MADRISSRVLQTVQRFINERLKDPVQCSIQVGLRIVTVPLALLLLRLEGRSFRDAYYVLQPNKAPDRYDALLSPAVTVAPPYVSELSRSNHLSRYLFAVQLFDDAGHWEGQLPHLDVACGTGYPSELLTPVGTDRGYVGVDISRRALEYATRYYDRADGYLQGDGTSLPVADDSFQTITCIETVEHVSDDEGLLRELRRVLASDGAAVVTTPNDEVLDRSEQTKEYPHVNSYSKTELEDLLRDVFEDASIDVYVQNTGLRDGGRIDRRVDQLHPYGFSNTECDPVTDDDYLVALVSVGEE